VPKSGEAIAEEMKVAATSKLAVSPVECMVLQLWFLVFQARGWREAQTNKKTRRND
jgi:hypothetical protein